MNTMRRLASDSKQFPQHYIQDPRTKTFTEMKISNFYFVDQCNEMLLLVNEQFILNMK